MTAKEGIQYLLTKCEQDEPIFILRAQDVLAPKAVLQWAHLAELHGVNEAKVCGAIEMVHAMDLWPVHRLPD